MAKRSRRLRSQPFSIRLGEHADLLVRDEVKRSGRSRSVVVEELAEEAAKTRLFPGVAFRGTPRRAWVIGTGLDVWEILELLLRPYADNEQQLHAAHPLIGERHVRLARAYGERFPDEIAAFVEDTACPLDELRQLYPFRNPATTPRRARAARRHTRRHRLQRRRPTRQERCRDARRTRAGHLRRDSRFRPGGAASNEWIL